MEKTQLTHAIYQALEALNGHGQVHDFWCTELWLEDGEVNYEAWTLANLYLLQGDVARYCA